MRAVGYIRVSTEEQAKEGISLDMQEAKIKAYCDLHDMDLMMVYRDEGISGKSIKKRPGLLHLLETVEDGRTEAVVIYKLDRLARNTLETLSMLETFDTKGISLHSITEKLDTQSAIGRFVTKIIAALAEMERDLISERTKAALAHKRANGEKTGGQPPYGYMAMPNGKLVRNDLEFEVVLEIHRKKTQGLSERRIVEYLNINRDIMPTRTGRPWTKTQVHRILHARAE